MGKKRKEDWTSLGAQLTVANLSCSKPAHSKLDCVASKHQPLMLFLFKKNMKAEDVTGGRTIVHEVIISLGHGGSEPSAFTAQNP